MKTIALMNHKGGVGKTTSVVNIASGLARMGYRVLAIDIDPQANLTISLGVNPDRDEDGIYNVLKDAKPINNAIVAVNNGQLDLLPSTLDLSGLEVELMADELRAYRLRNALKSVNYDYCIIDCPPSLGTLTMNALVAADSVYVPLQAQYLALDGLEILFEVVGMMKESNPNVSIDGIFLTQYDGRKTLHRDVAQLAKKRYGSTMFETYIRDNTKLAEAPIDGVSIFDYAPNSNGAADYSALCKEIKERTN